MSRKQAVLHCDACKKLIDNHGFRVLVARVDTSPEGVELDVDPLTEFDICRDCERTVDLKILSPPLS